MAQHKSLVTKVKRFVEVEPGLKLALIYGSFAHDIATEKSDLDLAIALDHPLNAEERIDISQRLSSLINREVDLVDLNTSHGLILEESLCKGQWLVKRDPELYASLLRRVWFDRSDFFPLRQRIFDQRRKSFEQK